MLRSLELWRDSRGRMSPLRMVTLALLAMPVAIALYDYLTVGFGPRPLNNVIHRTGYWALMFLMLALAITPLRRIARFAALFDVRRMIGVGSFCYAAAHILLYVADQQLDLIKVASEIVSRLYLTIGLVAFVALAVLAATSTDAMVRRLGGPRWRRLHQVVYATVLLALVHYFQQTKADVSVPIFAAGLFGWLIGYRLVVWWRQVRGELSTRALLALTLTVAALTFVGEAIGIAIAFKVSPLVVLQSALDFDLDTIRPGWLVVAAGLVVVLLDLIRVRTRSARRPPQAVAATAQEAG
jgi:methionine sulfoxide reductase heme-binding subunit